MQPERNRIRTECGARDDEGIVESRQLVRHEARRQRNKDHCTKDAPSGDRDRPRSQWRRQPRAVAVPGAIPRAAAECVRRAGEGRYPQQRDRPKNATREPHGHRDGERRQPDEPPVQRRIVAGKPERKDGDGEKCVRGDQSARNYDAGCARGHFVSSNRTGFAGPTFGTLLREKCGHRSSERSASLR